MAIFGWYSPPQSTFCPQCCTPLPQAKCTPPLAKTSKSQWFNASGQVRREHKQDFLHNSLCHAGTPIPSPLILKSGFLLDLSLSVQLKQFWVSHYPESVPRDVEGKKNLRTLTHHLINLSWSFGFPPEPTCYYFLSESSLVALRILNRVFRCNQWVRDWNLLTAFLLEPAPEAIS